MPYIVLNSNPTFFSYADIYLFVIRAVERGLVSAHTGGGPKVPVPWDLGTQQAYIKCPFCGFEGYGIVIIVNCFAYVHILEVVRGLKAQIWTTLWPLTGI